MKPPKPVDPALYKAIAAHNARAMELLIARAQAAPRAPRHTIPWTARRPGESAASAAARARANRED